MTKTRDLANLGGGFIQAGTGAVQRTVESKLQDVVSVLDFIPESEHAAIKDGTSIYNATTAIQAALNTGKSVLVPSGTFRVLSTLGIAASGQKLYGLGNTSVLKDETGANNFINISDKDNVTISDLKIIGTGSAAGIAISGGSRNFTVDSVYFYGGGQRVWLFTCDTVRVTNCTFEQTGYGIIQQVGTSSNDVLVANNTAINVDSDFVEANCAHVPSFNWVISNNVYEGCSLWPTVQTESRFVGITGVNGVVITGNTAKRVCGDAAVHLEDIGGEVIISNNYFVDVLGTGYIYVLNSDEHCVISNNILEHRDSTITPAPALWCLNNYSNDITFTGNRVKGIAANKVFDAFSVGFYSGQLIVSNNQFDTLRNVLPDSSLNTASIVNNRFKACTNPLVPTISVSSTAYRDFLISGNVFVGTTGGYDLRLLPNTNGTGVSQRCFITGNKFSKPVQVTGQVGGVVGSSGDASDIAIVSNVFSSASSLTTSGTMSRLVNSGNIFEATGESYIEATSVTTNDLTIRNWEPLKGKTHFSDYQNGVSLTGVVGDYNISDNVVQQVTFSDNRLSIGNGFILPKGYSGTVSYTVGQIAAGAFALHFESSVDGITWTTLQTSNNASTGAKTYAFSSLGAATALRFRFANGNGTNGQITVQNVVIPNLTATQIAQATGAPQVYLNNVYFPNVGTTASAANVVLDNASTPVNRLLRSTSSIQYKTQVEDLETQRADAILGLRPVWYRSLAEADPSEWSYYGLIAEEVAEIEPRLVTWTYPEDAYETVEETIEVDGEEFTRVVTRLKDGAVKVPDGVQYDRLPVLLLGIIQRQEQRITALESQTN